MSSPFIVIDEITSKINEMNTSLTTKIDNLIGATGNTGGSTTAGTVMAKLNKVITDTTTIINNTKANNTASTTGTLSQKISSAISNTAATTTESSTGTLSAKLSYLINRRDRLYIPGSGNLKTIATSLSIGSTGYNSDEDLTSWSNYTTGYYVCYDGTYRFYCTGTVTVSTLSTKYSPTPDNFLICDINVNGTSYSFTVASRDATVGTSAATTATKDIVLKRGDYVRCRAGARSYGGTFPCIGSVWSNKVTAAITDLSIRGTLKELNGVLT